MNLLNMLSGKYKLELVDVVITYGETGSKIEYIDVEPVIIEITEKQDINFEFDFHISDNRVVYECYVLDPNDEYEGKRAALFPEEKFIVIYTIEFEPVIRDTSYSYQIKNITKIT